MLELLAVELVVEDAELLFDDVDVELLDTELLLFDELVAELLAAELVAELLLAELVARLVT